MKYLDSTQGEGMARRKTAGTTNVNTSRELDEPTVLPARGRTLVFISHDSRDADLAEAFANLLSDVSAGTLKSFRSSDKKGTSGIEFGTEWYKAIMSQLGDATDVVALLTQHSIDRPWILYEAGVAKGKLDTNVLGIALGVPLDKVSSGPFGQFQNCGDDEDSLTKLVIQLIRRNPDASPREEAVRMQVQVFLQGVKSLLNSKGKSAGQTGADDSNVAKLFEEVKVMVRELPERVDDRVRSATKRGGLRRGRRLHPMMFEELLFHPVLRESNKGPASAWLLFISAMREDFPWLYELGMELYHALRSNNSKAVAEARRNLLAVLDITTHGPLFHEMYRPDDEELFFMVKHLPQMVERFLERTATRLRPSIPKPNEIEKAEN
ncbi:toll/interleukin-1 receptor domain-containing protein [Frateuria sp.]|uniref:toll/interleukin-1 receptor domain-containing protein n=1 Tax=Frateuria sp. TaxID=2211372 RepID=UPI001799B06A|nr:toll/interleukin-1 receptor domain-containing protein [Frateuria sp.]NUR22488.1 toll/interleukin-1 receptor domain-containing protein [Frateuria sp.]